MTFGNHLRAFAATVALVLPLPAVAQDKDSLVIAVPSDVQSWDAQVTNATAQTLILRTVFDAPLIQNEKLELIPNVIDEWSWSDDGLSLNVKLRSDVLFHNGDKLTTEDFYFTYITRMREDQRIQFAGVFNPVLEDIEIVSDTEAVMHLSRPFPVMPNWMGFLGQFITPKKYFEEVGPEEFARNPIGSGPYKLVSYQPGARIVLEAFDDYWGGAPNIKNLVFEIIKDPTARVAAIQSGSVDFATGVPIREAERLGQIENLAARIEPTTEVYNILLRDNPPLSDKNVRLAAYHAIDRAALSNAFFGGRANVVSVFGVPGMPSYPSDFDMPYDPELAKEYLAEAGFGPDNPVKLEFVVTNGAFPNDFEVARAVGAMWKTVGIDAEINVVDLNRYYEMSRSGQIEGASIAVWANATNDPELYIGTALNPNTRFSAWKSEELGKMIEPLLAETDYEARMEGYEKVNIFAAENVLVIPLLQAVQTIVYKEGLDFTWIPNGWYEPAKFNWAK